ncbi:hypothetical protein D3C80_546010 [compost metagenome]
MFYKDPKGDKAILQLAKNVKMLQDGEFRIFNFFPEHIHKIYPIIVVHSDTFNILGLNHILINWFKEARSKVGLSSKFASKTAFPVLIDISTLLFFKDALKCNRYHLNKIIDLYNDYILEKITVGDKAIKTAVPFSFFLNNFIRKNKKYMPRELLSEIKEFMLKSDLPKN